MACYTPPLPDKVGAGRYLFLSGNPELHYFSVIKDLRGGLTVVLSDCEEYLQLSLYTNQTFCGDRQKASLWAK